MTLILFIRENLRWLAAGLLLTFCSSFGQTYFISIFAGEIQTTFDLTDGQWGFFYMLGTGASGLLMIFAGTLADHWRVGRLALFFFLAFAAICIAMSQVSAAWMLPLIIFGLRFCGQGMISHIAVVAMARWYVANRGKAISIAGLGHALGEAFLPLIAVAVMVWIDWRLIWVAGAIALLLLLPVILRLLREEREPQSVAERDDAAGMGGQHWTRMDAIRDWRFWGLMPVMMVVGIFVTALFFQQVHIAEIKGISHLHIVALFPAYTTMTVAFGLVAGLAIDRFGASRIVPFYPLPMACAFLIIWQADGVLGLAAGFALMGIGHGFGGTLISAMWPEVYGTRHIGAIKSLATAFMVFGSAIGPAVTGYFIDLGYDFSQQSFGMALYLIGVSAWTYFVIRQILPELRDRT